MLDIVTQILYTILEEDAMSVGIREDGSWNFDDTDCTRVAYFIDKKL